MATNKASNHEPFERKFRHASYLFNEMSKFQKCGILCDVTVPGQLNLVPAHRVVLASARNSDGESATTPKELQIDDDIFSRGDDVFWLDEAYSSVGTEKKTDDEPDLTSSDSVENRLGVLNNLRRQSCLCDVTLLTDCCKCDAHKVVLAACSDYFKAMFTSSMLEHNMDTITLHGVDGSYLKRLLDFIYSGELPIEDWEDALELLKLGVFYQIHSLIEHCCSHLISNFSSDSACFSAHFGRELALKNLNARSLAFLHDHFLQLNNCGTQIYLIHADDLVQMLESDRLGGVSNSESELSILKIVLRWLLHHQSLLESAVEDKIVSLVRFSLIPVSRIMGACREVLDEFVSEKESTARLNYSPIFRKHLLGSLQYHEQVFNQPLLQCESTNLRTPCKTLVTIDGVITPSGVKMPPNCQFRAKSELQSSDGPIRDPFHSVVEINGFIYVLGGTRQLDEGYSNAVFRYDPRLDTCIKVASMLEPRGDFVAVSIEDFIYVFGGRNRRGALRTCERYDSSKNTWTSIASLPEELYMAAGTAARGKVFINGGFNNYETVGSTFCYDPKPDTCKQVSSMMMSERGYHVMIEADDGRLWIVGGIDNPFSGRNVWDVEAFNPITNMWSYVGQVLPVKLLNSTLRLNVFLNAKKNICISAVTFPGNYAMLEYDSSQRMWLEMKQRVPMINLNLQVSKKTK